MMYSLNYVRQLIIKIACDTTGDEPRDLLKSARLEIAPRDAIEFMVRLEAAFDCVLGRLRYTPLSTSIDELAFAVLSAHGEAATKTLDKRPYWLGERISYEQT